MGWQLEYTLSDGSFYSPRFLFCRFCSLVKWLNDPERQKSLKLLGVIHVQPMPYRALRAPEIVP